MPSGPLWILELTCFSFRCATLIYLPSDLKNHAWSPEQGKTLQQVQVSVQAALPLGHMFQQIQWHLK